MTDRRLTPANDRAALATLRGVVDAPRHVAGEPAAVAVPLADLRAAPGGARDRQVVLGEALTVIDRHEGWAFVRMGKDGYCGYLPDGALGEPGSPTHWVAAPASHLYPEPRVQAEARAALPLNARLTVLAETGDFAETSHGFVPRRHLRDIGNWHADPVAVAQTLLGTPYLWGGNSRAGVDCSGLVQMAMLACGRDCPADSDLQQSLGEDVPAKKPLRRGDLVFWTGHVAMAMNADHVIHATAAFMAVVAEPLAPALKRIEAARGGPVTARRRP